MVLQSSVKHSSGPPSPTLTNPDMILPYTADCRILTPSPPLRAIGTSSSPEALGAETVHPLQQQNLKGTTPGWRTAAPRNSLPLGSYGSGTMLPDIEEVETTSKVARSKRTSPGNRSPSSYSPGLSSMEEDAEASADRYSKRLSYCSSSAQSEDFDFGNLDGIDGAASGYGEDEEEEDNSPVTADANYQSTNLTNGAKSDIVIGGMDREAALSSAALSKRAERILANAKKRLTSMEGNLSRARHSLMASPTSSPMFSISGENIDASQQRRQQLSNINGWGISPTKHRQSNSPLSSSSTSPGHSRVFSESSVPSSLHTSPQSIRGETEALRASSAMGSVGMTPTLRDRDGSKSSVTTDRARKHTVARSSSFTGHHPSSLQPLNEEESVPVPLQPADTISAGAGQDSCEQLSSVSMIESRFPTSTTLTRSRSSMQMRDLREQMQDLKGKISTLKERARTDNLRRRSLQSLRMPSPFTAAEQWYTGPEVYRNGRRATDAGFRPNELPSPLELDEGKGPEKVDSSQQNDEQGEPKAREGAEDVYSVDLSLYENAQEYAGEKYNHRLDGEDATPADEPDAYDQRSTVAEDNVEVDSIMGDQDFYETSPSPMGERHEDREDAFDYEHFFLRSDMGDYSRPNHGRRDSFTSTDSAETTRGPTVPNDTADKQVAHAQPREASHLNHIDNAWLKGHQRNNSVDSVSTFATFATATEGRGSDGDEEEWEQYQRSHPMAGTWDQDYFSQKSSATVPQIWSRNSHMATRPDSAIQVNGHLTPGSPTRSSTPSITRSFPLVNKPKHLTPSPSPQPPPILVSALMAPVRTADSTTGPPLQLSKEDGDLVEGLLDSLGKVCTHLSSEGQGNSRYEGRVWRRRVDAARRILDGELDEEALQELSRN